MMYVGMRIKLWHTKTRYFFLENISRSAFQEVNKFVKARTNFICLIDTDKIWVTEDFLIELEQLIQVPDTNHELAQIWLSWVVNCYKELNPERINEAVGLSIKTRTTRKHERTVCPLERHC